MPHVTKVYQQKLSTNQVNMLCLKFIKYCSSALALHHRLNVLTQNVYICNLNNKDETQKPSHTHFKSINSDKGLFFAASLASSSSFLTHLHHNILHDHESQRQKMCTMFMSNAFHYNSIQSYWPMHVSMQRTIFCCVFHTNVIFF